MHLPHVLATNVTQGWACAPRSLFHITGGDCPHLPSSPICPLVSWELVAGSDLWGPPWEATRSPMRFLCLSVTCHGFSGSCGCAAICLACCGPCEWMSQLLHHLLASLLSSPPCPALPHPALPGTFGGLILQLLVCLLWLCPIAYMPQDITLQ